MLLILAYLVFNAYGASDPAASSSEQGRLHNIVSSTGDLITLMNLLNRGDPEVTLVLYCQWYQRSLAQILPKSTRYEYCHHTHCCDNSTQFEERLYTTNTKIAIGIQKKDEKWDSTLGFKTFLLGRPTNYAFIMPRETLAFQTHLSSAVNAALQNMWETANISQMASYWKHPYEFPNDVGMRCYIPNRNDTIGLLRKVLNDRSLNITGYFRYSNKRTPSFQMAFVNSFCEHFNNLAGDDGVKYSTYGAVGCNVQFLTSKTKLYYHKQLVHQRLLKGTAQLMFPAQVTETYEGTAADCKSKPCTNYSDDHGDYCKFEGLPYRVREDMGKCWHKELDIREMFRVSFSTWAVDYAVFIRNLPSPPSEENIKLHEKLRMLLEENENMQRFLIFAAIGLCLTIFIIVVKSSKPKLWNTSYPGMDDARFPVNSRTLQLDIQQLAAAVQQEFQREQKHIVAFVNAGSGDQRGDTLVASLQMLLGSHGSVCKLPMQLDDGFRLAEYHSKDKRVIFLAAGGDGTVTWVLSEVQRRKAGFSPVPPVGIIPLGTGNDLARSLGWGVALADNRELVDYVRRALHAEPVFLDQWKLTLIPDKFLPPALVPESSEPTLISQSFYRHPTQYVGYFTNYFSIGMDAETTYEVGRARHDGIGKLCFQTRCIKPCRFIHGGFLCYALNSPNIFRCMCCRRRALNYQKDFQLTFNDDPTPIVFQREIRQISFTNLNSYGAGMHLYGAGLMQSDVSPVDSRLEVFTLQGPCSLIGITGIKKLLGLHCCDVKIGYQPRKVNMRLSKGQFFQMDGEPWMLQEGCDATIEPYAKVRVLCPLESGDGAGAWNGSQKRSFWTSPQRDSGTSTEIALSSRNSAMIP